MKQQYRYGTLGNRILRGSDSREKALLRDSPNQKNPRGKRITGKIKRGAEEGNAYARGRPTRRPRPVKQNAPKTRPKYKIPQAK